MSEGKRFSCGVWRQGRGWWFAEGLTFEQARGEYIKQLSLENETLKQRPSQFGFRYCSCLIFLKRNDSLTAEHVALSEKTKQFEQNGLTPARASLAAGLESLLKKEEVKMALLTTADVPRTTRCRRRPSCWRCVGLLER